MVWSSESWQSVKASGLLSVRYLTSMVREPLNGYAFIEKPPWLLYQLRFIEHGGSDSFEIAIEEVHRGLFVDRDPLGIIGKIALSDPVVGVLLTTQAYQFTVGRSPTRVATRTLTYVDEMSFEGQLVEGGEPKMVIGSTQPPVAEALVGLLSRSGCSIVD